MCNSTVEKHHPLLQGVPTAPVCATHGPRRLALDLREFSRGWVCCRGSPPEALPGPANASRCGQPCFACAVGAWPECRTIPTQPGPTKAQIINNMLASGRTHSWLFVPLLHAAVGRLHSNALDARQAHAYYAPLWQRALDAFAKPRLCSPPHWHSGVRRSPPACSPGPPAWSPRQLPRTA